MMATAGHEVVVTDRKPLAELGTAAAALAGVARLEAGGHRRESFRTAELVVLSPGVPLLPEVDEARRAGVPVTGEIELASRSVQATGAGGLCVLELSSFQLETCETFHPRVAVLLNITADHLDRYASLADYAAAKGRIFARQQPEDAAVVNARDPLCVKHAVCAGARLYLFNSEGRIGRGAFLDRGDIVLRLHEDAAQEERYPAGDLPLVGRHNLENAMAAYLAARLVGARPEHVRAAARSFRPLPHRMEPVGERSGVLFYDDSKGTNVGAVVASLDGFPRPFVLIAGGRDKGGDYTPLAQAVLGRARAVVLIGEAADRIERSLSDAGVGSIRRAADLEAAVALAAAGARAGDAVVLSPACSSFDMFRDYRHRGEVFRRAVEALA
jgi:UDP-N-acetylmuramoylalanine--D-glutamate ligase